MKRQVAVNAAAPSALIEVRQRTHCCTGQHVQCPHTAVNTTTEMSERKADKKSSGRDNEQQQCVRIATNSTNSTISLYRPSYTAS